MVSGPPRAASATGTRIVRRCSPMAAAKMPLIELRWLCSICRSRHWPVGYSRNGRVRLVTMKSPGAGQFAHGLASLCGAVNGCGRPSRAFTPN